MYHFLFRVGFKLYFLHVPQKKEKKALELHIPCLVFAPYTRFCFKFLSFVNYMYKLSTFAVVFYTYDATQSHTSILKLCLKTINTNSFHISHIASTIDGQLIVPIDL